MTDDIRSMSAALANDPQSLVFLDLAELLRRRGQLDAALKVATAGVARHRKLADAHDLCARVYSDLGDGEAAFDAWMEALQLDTTHLGAHKGLGFLYFRAGDLSRALRHLELASEAHPDAGLDAAVARVRHALEESAGASAAADVAADAAGGDPDHEDGTERVAGPALDSEPAVAEAALPGPAHASDAELFAGF